MGRICLGGLAVFLLLAKLPLAQVPVFRGTTRVVAMDVAVDDGNVPVTGLTASDFVVSDNGIPQAIAVEPADSSPLDVTFIIDLGSGPETEWLKQYRREVMALSVLLRPTDRFELVGFSEDIARSGLLAGGTAPDFDSLIANIWPQAVSPPIRRWFTSNGGPCAPGERVAQSALGTAVYDAVAGPLMAMPQRNRRQLALVFTGGYDMTSVVTADQLLAIARRSSTVLFAARPPWRARCIYQPTTLAARALALPSSSRILDDVAKATGGAVYLQSDAVGAASMQTAVPTSVVTVAARALDRFRQRYLLSYQPRGVVSAGWHDVTVRVMGKPTYRIEARPGYFGESEQIK